MDIPGVDRVTPEETERLERLAQMMGRAFLAEPWTMEMIARMGLSSEQALEASVQVMRTNMFEGAPYKRVYCLPDESACLIAYQASELTGFDNEHFEELAMKGLLALPWVDDAVVARALEMFAVMEPVSDFGWYPQFAPGDFIHMVDLGVDPEKQGSGAASRIMRAFFAYADQHALPCFLETFADNLEAIYTHLGMQTVARKEAPGIEIIERCMMREPH